MEVKNLTVHSFVQQIYFVTKIFLTSVSVYSNLIFFSKNSYCKIVYLCRINRLPHCDFVLMVYCFCS